MHDEEEMEFIFGLTDQSEPFWIGGKRNCHGCNSWNWIEGGKINYFKWNSQVGEPNNIDGREDCIEVRSGIEWGYDYRIGTWNDIFCNEREYYHGFVCKSN